MNTKTIVLAVAVLVVLSVVGLLYRSSTKDKDAALEELGSSLGESAVETPDVAPGANPINQVLPTANPIEKTNPFKNEYQNPFE